MVPGQIEREIVIDAPIDVVWSVVTEPDQIQHWFAPETELDGRKGGPGRFRFQSGETYYLRVEAFEPPHRFAYRWMHEKGAEPRPDNSMLVEFTLREESGSTRLRLTESGFHHVDWTDEAKVKYFDDHSRGWATLMDRLRAHATSR